MGFLENYLLEVKRLTIDTYPNNEDEKDQFNKTKEIVDFLIQYPCFHTDHDAAQILDLVSEMLAKYSLLEIKEFLKRIKKLIKKNNYTTHYEIHDLIEEELERY